MRKTLIALACLAALLCLTLSASAEPAVSRGGYTAYLGPENSLYLEDPTGATSWLNVPIADIVDVTDAYVFCLAQDGRLIRINLDGSHSDLLANQATQEQIDEVRSAPLYTLDGTTLTLANAAENALPLSTTALAACTNGDTLYWIESAFNGATTLKSLLLGETGAVAQLLGEGVADPLGMIATDETLTIVAGDHSVTVVALIDRSRVTYPATSEVTVRAAAIGDQLLRYTQDENGLFITEANDVLSLLTPVNAVAVTIVPTATPTTRPTATVTVRPTATPRPTTSSSSGSTYDRLSKGDRGADVRKMQKRLAELGYPVGVVDGVWGDDTQLAVNLFQCAIGYTERNYATSAMLEKLYSKKAPAYNPYAPLKQGDKGTDVLIMQTTLQLMGYDPGKLDGIYGQNTAAAISQFQKVAGLKVTGAADAETLKVLYSPDCPLNPDVYPTPTPTPPATNPPATDAPATNPPATDAPTATPTPAPSDEPTDKPTDAPTEEPTAEPTEKPIEITQVVIVSNDTKQPLTKAPNPGDKITVKVSPEGAVFDVEWHYLVKGEIDSKVISTDAVYTITSSDLGKELVCVVIGKNGYTGTVNSKKDPIVATTTDLR